MASKRPSLLLKPTPAPAITPEEAKLQKFLDGQAAEKTPAVEAEPAPPAATRSKRTITMDDELYARARHASFDKKMNFSEFIEAALREYLDK